MDIESDPITDQERIEAYQDAHKPLAMAKLMDAARLTMNAANILRHFPAHNDGHPLRIALIEEIEVMTALLLARAAQLTDNDNTH